MPVKDPKEMFVKLLSDVRQGTERTTKIFEEMSTLAQDPDVKEARSTGVYFKPDPRQA